MLGGAQITFLGSRWLYRQLKKGVDTFIQIIDRQFTDIYKFIKTTIHRLDNSKTWQFIVKTIHRHDHS